MKYIYLVALLLASVTFSGCIQPTPEERAIAIADQLPETRLISKGVDSMQRADQCTFDKFWSGTTKISEIVGASVPELTESIRMQIEGRIQRVGALVKRCQVTLSKSAEKESENIYIVHYKFETISDPECSIISEGDAKVRVDLSTEKAGPIGGGNPYGREYNEALEEMEDCMAMLFIRNIQGS